VESLTCPDGQYCLKVVMGDRNDIPANQRHWGNVRIPLPGQKISPQATALRFWIKSDGDFGGLGLTLTMMQQWNWMADRGDRKSWLDFADGTWRQLECRLEDFVPYNPGATPSTPRNFAENSSVSFQLAGWYGQNIGRTLTFYLDQIEIVVPANPHPRRLLIALAGSTDCRQRGQDGQYHGWGEALPEFFSPTVSIRNFSLPGCSSKWFIEQGLWEDLLRLQPDCIFLSLGNADALPGDRHTAPDGAYRENLRRFAREAKQARADLYFIAPVELSSADRCNGRLAPPPGADSSHCAEYRAAMQAIASEHGLPFIEIATESGQHYPAPELARRRARAIIRALQRLGPPWPEYLLQANNTKE
jgi:lysophospholipase L1-like esterase